MENTPLKFLWYYTKKLKTYMIGTTLIFLLTELTIRVGLYYGSRIVDIVLKSSDKDATLKAALTMTIIYGLCMLASGAIHNSIGFLQAKFQPYYALLVSKDLFAYVHKHSPAFFIEEMSGRIGGKIKNVIDACYEMYFVVSWGVIYTFVGLITTIAFLFPISISMGAILTVYMSLFTWAMIKMSKAISYYSEKYSDASAEATGILIDSFTNVLEVKNFGTYNFEKRNYFKALRKVRDADTKEIRKYVSLFYAQAFLQHLSLVLFGFLSLYYWYYNLISTADFVLVGSLLGALNTSLRHIGYNAVQLFKLNGKMKDGLKLLSRPHDITDNSNAKKLIVKEGNIKFDNICFNYKRSDHLFKDFSVEIKAGEKIGLVGRSGSGKSSFIKLISRYYDIQKGTISIDGTNIKDVTQESFVTQESLHRNISIIPQDITLFNRTLIENIRYGKISASDEEVFEAAKKAFADEFIEKLPDGYQSKVGERGVMLSGGQRQRIAIARAILKDAPFLILDEATSALDSESEKYIQKSIKRLMKGKTVLAIAHRLSTLREMDRILVFDNGKIAESGTHEELISNNEGIYNMLWDMQSGEFRK